jgi:hypothetical protein
MLINSVKDVASALGDLIHATKSASGKSINDPAMISLKDSAKVRISASNNAISALYFTFPFDPKSWNPPTVSDTFIH